jgi:endonuclease YncB( thermonuclease family)
MKKNDLLEEGNKAWDPYLDSYSKEYKESQNAVEKRKKNLNLDFFLCFALL